MFKKVFLLSAIVLAIINSCTKDTKEPLMGGYSFGKIYLYVDGVLVDIHKLEIILQAEEGFTDLEVVTGKLEYVKYLEGDDFISIELFSDPLDGAIDNPWSYKQKIRVKHSANQGVKPRSCSYRIFAGVADGVAADITFKQNNQECK